MRVLLTASEIQRLDQLYVSAFRSITALHEQDALARRIHLPKVPAALTESLTALNARRLLGDVVGVAAGTNRHDLELQLAGGCRLSVAVKGTGPSRWITVTSTDRRAGALVWIDYTNRLMNSSDAVDAYVFSRPAALAPGAERLTLARLLRLRPDVEPCTLEF